MGKRLVEKANYVALQQVIFAERARTSPPLVLLSKRHRMPKPSPSLSTAFIIAPVAPVCIEHAPPLKSAKSTSQKRIPSETSHPSSLFISTLAGTPPRKRSGKQQHIPSRSSPSPATASETPFLQLDNLYKAIALLATKLYVSFSPTEVINKWTGSLASTCLLLRCCKPLQLRQHIQLFGQYMMSMETEIACYMLCASPRAS